MQSKSSICALILAVVPGFAFAQKWEIGVGGGGGFYTSKSVTGSGGDGSVKVGNGVAASAWLANNNSRLWGGELRYDFQGGDLKVSSGGASATFSGQSHALHYDFLLHFADRDAKTRPFVAFGAGVKQYRGTGTEVTDQPLSQIALLTKTNQTVPLVSVGAGVKIRMSRSVGLRLEVHDFLTPFPDNVIAPAEGQSLGGWTNDFVAMLGLSILF